MILGGNDERIGETGSSLRRLNICERCGGSWGLFVTSVDGLVVAEGLLVGKMERGRDGRGEGSTNSARSTGGSEKIGVNDK